MQWIVPLWEDAAASMGLPRDLDGVMRLHRAACYSDDPLVMELTWAGIATMTDAQRLILDQQALLDL